MSIKQSRPPTTAGIYYTLPAVSGIQAGREYFTAMCPLALVPRLFPMMIDQSRPELHLQRILNPSRVPEIARYLVRHPKSYVLSSLTASVDAEVEFERLPGAKGPTSLGNLRIPMTAQLLLHDGLHRRAAIEAALKSDPELGSETIPLVLFVDKGLRRSEQMFTDLKRNEAHSGRSRSIACDHRDELARLVKAVLTRVPAFTELTEMARSTISNRSTKLFTFSGLYHATVILLSDRKQDPFGRRLTLAADFWLEVAKHIPDWSRASEHMVTTAELRRGYVHAHALALASLARVGKTLLAKYPSDWRRRLHPLATLDWSRSNTRLWEGRAMIGGRISKARTCVVLTGNVIKRHLGLPLDPEEEEVESRLRVD
jgi:DNA sulfur modification protein DndB